MSPFPTPCKGKSKNQSFAHTFALTGRRRLCIDTQGVALGWGLAALSGRSFSRFVRLSCALCFATCYLAQNRAEIFLDFEHTTLQLSALNEAHHAFRIAVVAFRVVAFR